MNRNWGIAGLWATFTTTSSFFLLGTLLMLVNYEISSVNAGGPPGLYAEWLYPDIIPAPHTPKIHPALRHAKKLPLRAYIEIQRPNSLKLRRRKPKVIIHHHGPPPPPGPPPPSTDSVTTVIHHDDISSLPPSGSFDVVSVNGPGVPYGPPPDSSSFTGGPPPSHEEVYVSPPSSPQQFSTSVDTSSPFENSVSSGGGSPLSSLYDTSIGQGQISTGQGGSTQAVPGSVNLYPTNTQSTSASSGLTNPSSIYTKPEVGPLTNVPGQLEPGYRYSYKSPALYPLNNTANTGASSNSGASSNGNNVGNTGSFGSASNTNSNGGGLSSLPSGVQDLYRTLPKVSLVKDANDENKVSFLFDGKFLLGKDIVGAGHSGGGGGENGGGISFSFGAAAGLNQDEEAKKILQDDSIWNYEKYDEQKQRRVGGGSGEVGLDLVELGSSPQGRSPLQKADLSSSSSKEFLITKLLKQLMKEELDEREKGRISKSLDIFGDKNEDRDFHQRVVDPIGKVIKNSMLGEYLVKPNERSVDGDFRLTLSGTDRGKFYFEKSSQQVGSRVFTEYPGDDFTSAKCLLGKRVEGSEVQLTSSCNEEKKEIMWNILPIQDGGRFWIQQKGTNFCLQPSVDLTVPTFVEMKSCDLYEPYQFWEVNNAIPKY